ncbi:MAG: VWA domain-containing protein [Planctomycetota bacterium JB042]
MLSSLLPALVAAVLSSAPESPTDALGGWFRRYRALDPATALWSDATIQRARLECGRDAILLEEFERFETALNEHLGVDEVDAHLSSPATVIATIRENRAFLHFRERPRLEAYADLLERLDLAAAEASPEALALLLDVAAHEAGRTYTPRDWKTREPFRPHLVRREARLALLRVPFSRSLAGLRSALEDGASAPARRAVAARLVATLVPRDALPAFHRFRLLDAAWSLLVDDGEEADVRAAAAGVVLAVLDADRETTLPDPKLVRLVDTVDPRSDDALNAAVLAILRTSPREVVLDRLARRFARLDSWSVRTEDALRIALDHLTPVRFTVETAPEEIVAWIEAERGTVRFQDWLLERQRIWRQRDGSRLEKRYAEAPRFYGVPIVGRRVVFVIDGSGSMQEVIDPATMKTKIAAARAELSGTIEGLDEEVRFDIVGFNDDVRQLAETFLPATKGNKRRAARFIHGTGSFGWTDLFGALTRAIGLTDVGGRMGRKARPVPDQVVLLSDGRPTRGLMTNGFDIVEEVSRLNRTRDLRIDTIAFGDEADRVFLGLLAERNGGELVVFPPE